MAEKRAMKKVHYNPPHKGSFRGVEQLRKAMEDEMGKKVQTEKVKKKFV